ncbi:3-oxoacyl-ACP reductase [Pokkaliibacter plantistimulans]|uniref:3-oxoacyl-ACP reductase n=1 Tax=Pokkaliibacter plantistimulans TaxID=1635171 RepID=A0ABX5M177_9GAMM|nr:YciK family oxidoreductase [Pokkaliibacter plantistimulans]PXF31326.1 3-oxoacyl-ACP reductase [Pokkaliibacter plantistimulans]
MNCYFDYSAPKDLLKGRVIVVTGAGDGIGRSAALSFAAHGATVVLMGRTTSKLEKVYDDIEQAGHPQPAIIPIHFEGATPHDYEMIAGKLEEEFGRLDGVLFNASILGLRTPISQYDTDIWAQVIQVNLNSQFYMTRALLPLLEKSTDASIVYTSSSVGRKGRAYWGAYAVSKFATEGLMQTLADELENTSSIRVNSINPGATRTSMRAYAYPAENPAEVRTPEEIMPTYLYLMGADSKGTTGQAFDAQPPKI